MKIAWRVYDTSQVETKLLQGETPKFLAVPLNAGENRKVSYPVVSFAKIYRPLLRGRSELQGNYRIEVWVSDVRFADGTAGPQPAAFLYIKKANWKADAPVAFVEVKSKPAPLLAQDLGCPHQVCAYDYNERCDRCVPESGGTCGWRTCSDCANGRCPGPAD